MKPSLQQMTYTAENFLILIEDINVQCICTKSKMKLGTFCPGSYIVRWIDTNTADVNVATLEKGDTWHNPPMVPTQITCIKEGTIVEVSTADSVEDNYRVEKGDSQ